MVTKFLLYILDKVVWMLLITVLTTQALQIAGVLQSPKSLSEITYSQENNYEFKLSADDVQDFRGKRQTATAERSSVLDGIFNIPIATLNAVNELLQRSWPAFQRYREASAARRLEETRRTEREMQELEERQQQLQQQQQQQQQPQDSLAQRDPRSRVFLNLN